MKKSSKEAVRGVLGWASNIATISLGSGVLSVLISRRFKNPIVGTASGAVGALAVGWLAIDNCTRGELWSIDAFYEAQRHEDREKLFKEGILEE